MEAPWCGDPPERLSGGGTRGWLLGFRRGNFRFRGRCFGSWTYSSLRRWTRLTVRAAAQRGEIVDHLVQRDLAEGLDRLDHRHLEMQLLVRRPFHPAFGFGELLDQLEEAIGFDQSRLLA